jgi:hypothetical protein
MHFNRSGTIAKCIALHDNNLKKLDKDIGEKAREYQQMCHTVHLELYKKDQQKKQNHGDQ